MSPVLTRLDEVNLSRLLLHPTHEALEQIHIFLFREKILSVLLPL